MKAAEDLKWLLERLPEATERQKEMFVEKVCICCIEGGMAEEDARKQVLAWLVGA